MKTEKLGTFELETWAPDELALARDARRVVVIDVRSAAEYATERLGGSLLMPMAEFDAAALPDQEVKKIVLICANGLRSARVARGLISSGLQRIGHLDGGIAGWKAAGLPWRGLDPETGSMAWQEQSLRPQPARGLRW
ncbi:Rhodanese-related sulfurtransferase [Pseudooceanicola antarcticus]|uniref:Rhodanese-like domain-containing protein n=1 Tax=Pseudooceanicola antarcticus TaxID=1247613 RepID=A0A285HLG5_9RHOB|nr:rhodanese-like domain-containing protein [Pseudooceanicola antarcticus]PJE27980.1 rhodanese-like domain-containing protein [Pseudooceanicola antarcticus]SNY35531.1 Rhodanese-related sulfurtransferase [Pseudooceanicola antarcticus]